MSKFDPKKDEFLPNGSRIIHSRKDKNYWIWLSYYERPTNPWLVCTSHVSTPAAIFDCHYFELHSEAYKAFFGEENYERWDALDQKADI